MSSISIYWIISFIIVFVCQTNFSESLISKTSNTAKSDEIFDSGSTKFRDAGLETKVSANDLSGDNKIVPRKEGSLSGQTHHHRRRSKKKKHRKNKRRRKDRRHSGKRVHFPLPFLSSEIASGSPLSLNRTNHKIEIGSKKRFKRKFKRKNLRKGSNSTKDGKEDPFLTTSLLRGKRLSHNPRRFRLNGGGQGQGRGHAKSLLGTSPAWVRNLHYHHERLASSMRKRIQNQLERTRQHWLNSINPDSVLYNTIPTFPEITENLIPPIPSFYSSFIPSLRRKKNNYPTKNSKSGNGKHFIESKNKKLIPRNWANEITTLSSVLNDSYISNRDQKQFKVTRTLLKDNEIVPVSSTTTDKNIVTEFNPEGKNSVWFKTKTDSPNFGKNNSKDFDDNQIPILTERPTEPSSKVPEEEIRDNRGTKYIPYGNDVTKGKNNGWTGTGNKGEQDWEWVPIDKDDNDVNYNPTVIEEEEEEAEEEEEEEKTTDEKDDEETQIETTNNEDESEKDDNPQIDVENCLKCPSRRRIHFPRGQDYVPLFIPTPQDTCNYQRGILRYHVEVGPGNPNSGTLIGEELYFVNVTILGGAKGLTPIKTCTYDYEVQVNKCPPLPIVEGGSAECSAGEAWGSKCNWKCDKDRRIVGASSVSCGGDKNSPSWQNKPPVCEEYGCPIPKGLEGMSISCSVPVPHEILGLKLENMKFYPKGTRCQVRCKPGFALKGDQYSGRKLQMSKCLANGKWFPDISNCCIRERIPPQPFIGDCDDMNVQLTGQGAIHLIPPRFFTSTGKPAHVWCDLDTVRHEGRHCRTCKAHDKALGLISSCRQCISVSSRLGCPSIRAPKNGNLECRNTAEGDILCNITCKNGYFIPPYISSNSVKCRRGMSLWDFQTYRNEPLPSCVLR